MKLHIFRKCLEYLTHHMSIEEPNNYSGRRLVVRRQRPSITHSPYHITPPPGLLRVRQLKVLVNCKDIVY
jgi:hypothetical protein